MRNWNPSKIVSGHNQPGEEIEEEGKPSAKRRHYEKHPEQSDVHRQIVSKSGTNAADFLLEHIPFQGPWGDLITSRSRRYRLATLGAKTILIQHAVAASCAVHKSSLTGVVSSLTLEVSKTFKKVTNRHGVGESNIR